MKIKNKIASRTAYWVYISLLIWSIPSCQKSELLTYDRENSIYIHTVAGSLADSINISMGYLPVSRQDSVINFILRCTGVPLDHDRSVTLTTDTGTTALEGIHYEFLEQPMIPAGQANGTFRLKINRDGSLKEKQHVLRLKLMDNEYFNTNIASEKKRYRIFMSDIAAQPTWWHNNILGTFSLEKMLLMVELLNIDPTVTSMSIELLQYYGVFMQRYLNGMLAANTPVYEEDGVTLMVMGPSSQN